MSWTGPVFPSLPLITFPQPRDINWNANKQDALSGKKTRYSLYTYPTYSYELPISALRTAAAFTEWQTFMGFVNKLAGPVGMFGYDDTLDDTVAQATPQQIGVSDGVTAGPYQIVRSLGGFVEPVFLLNGAPNILVNGVSNANWTVDAYGRITFTAGNVPPASQTISWYGQYYWPCFFDDDSTNLEKFMFNLYEAKAIKFTTTKLP